MDYCILQSLQSENNGRAADVDEEAGDNDGDAGDFYSARGIESRKNASTFRNCDIEVVFGPIRDFSEIGQVASEMQGETDNDILNVLIKEMDLKVKNAEELKKCVFKAYQDQPGTTTQIDAKLFTDYKEKVIDTWCYILSKVPSMSEHAEGYDKNKLYGMLILEATHLAHGKLLESCFEDLIESLLEYLMAELPDDSETLSSSLTSTEPHSSLLRLVNEALWGGKKFSHRLRYIN